MSRYSRRRFIQGAGTLAAAGLAGCTGATGLGGTDGEPSAQASFFVVADFTTRVTGDAVNVDNLVPFGQHGHGWEPGPNIQRDIMGSDAFVYVGEGFQPWADKIVQNIHDDDADVAIVEAWADVDLLENTDDHEDAHDHGDEHDDEHDHEAEHEDEHDGEHDDEHDHEAEHEGEDEHDHEDEHEDDHDHGAHDPHFWLDPVRAAQSVHTIAHDLGDVFPSEAATFESNADSYASRLDDLHHTFEERLAGRTRDTVLFAGHNSFRYLANRYDFHVESLTGLSPDDTPSPKDISRAQALIEEHGIEYVLGPVFESDRAATQLVEQTDAVDVLPLTPIPTLATEWAENDWGFVDVMEQINLPSLERALGTE